MLRKIVLAAAIGSICAPSLAQEASPRKLETSGALFGVRPSVEDIDLSPDGKRIVYVTPGRGRTSVAFVAELDGSKQQAALEVDGNPERLRWCKFVTDQRLVCNISGQADAGGVLVPFSRLLALNIDGSNQKPLGQRTSQFDARLRQFDGDILDWMPASGGSVLMARDYVPERGKMNTNVQRRKDGLGIDRIDTLTMAVKPVESPRKDVDSFMTDGRGVVRMKSFVPVRGATGKLDARTVFSYRLPGSTEWQPFSTWDESETGMFPVAIEADTNSAYALKKLDGRLALYRVKLDGSLAAELVHAHPKVDVDGVVRIANGERVIGVTFADEMRETVYFDPEYKRLAASWGKALPKLPIINFVGASSGTAKLLVRAGSDSDPGRYYVYDRASRSLNEVMLERPTLEGVQLANVKPITYPAADGTAVPAYLTLPPGKETARGLPAVVLPHGGPSARDEWGFDWLAQYFAHEGYAVIQPNYRGSAGYGDDWLQENGFKSWRTSIGDVNAAGRWLVSEGIADPARLAIVGWSYGGYAALQSAVVEPELFKAIVAIAPVTDLEMVKSDARDYTNSHNVSEYIGSGPHVTEGSPLQNAGRFKAPVLMFHGDLDLNVRVRHARAMDAKLKSEGKASELVVYEGLEHQLADSNARALMLDRIGGFLKANLQK
ncbi:alpha/beta hydrolase family protein [Lysobacter korlensis]|uniref:Alpha/beta hydrolase family protein n=1 Tax=Lysobacter korlensis TaxID=553636 RepID=A0ABV6RIS7_9GAMM